MAARRARLDTKTTRDRETRPCHTEGYAPKEWCTEGHLFHVLAGESTLWFRDGDRAIRFRAGDTGIILGGEAHAHNVEPAAGEYVRFLLFEQD